MMIHELKYILKIAYSWLNIKEVMAVLLFYCCVKGGASSGGSASIVPWRLAIVRVPLWSPSVSAVFGRWSWGVRTCPAVVLSSRSCAWLALVWPPSIVESVSRYAGCNSMQRLHELDPVWLCGPWINWQKSFLNTTENYRKLMVQYRLCKL